MEIPLGLLICGGIIVVIAGGVFIVAMALGIILLEYAAGLVLLIVGVVTVGWFIISALLTPVQIPFLAPANTPAPLVTPDVSERDVENALARFGSDIELLQFMLREGNVVEIEYRFMSPKPVANDEIKQDAANTVICALRKYQRRAISYNLKLVGQARHEDEYFGIKNTKPAGERQFSAQAANGVNCGR